MINQLKRKLAGDGVVLGTFITLNCPDLVEIAGLAGFDYCIIDTEHGPGNPESIQHMIRAAELRGMAAIVRVTDTAPTTILRTLDVGAAGIQVPQVNSPETAENVVRSAKYFPKGDRGACLTRSSRYGFVPGVAEYFDEANRETLVIVHCENRQGLECLDGIAAVDGVDVIFVGPYDLSQSFGIPGQIYHPVMVDAVARALAAAKRAGKPAGIFVGSVEEAKARIEQGFTYIAYSTDSLVFAEVCKNIVGGIRG
ncbi:5-keto-4-deoxy-D-glucarate aldolase [bioreactor metagenome]|uniref:5-keto-4-deoxy-D-glucarate aldolase n=1 Tax=bioreactor metagenome TaxID=1076179 RepID=A0A644VV32_9ZZZZ|nr:aldolase/citrate lyase family protein [Aminivibrio sp.]MDD3514761.1 aldolase/citrate lyase family protein [Synergistaceae bacterium]MEA4951506.1 aldolase/citrate lyase family protein [Aminivibrio sp.]